MRIRAARGITERVGSPLKQCLARSLPTDSERVTRRFVGCGARPGHKFLCVSNYGEGTIFDRTRTPLAVRFTGCWLFAVQTLVACSEAAAVVCAASMA